MQHKEFIVLGVDPSGNFQEGKGVTGLACINQNAEITYHGVVKAECYDSTLAYWDGVLRRLDELTAGNMPTILSIEDYILYAATARSQINSVLETPKIIGAILMWAYARNMPIYMRSASQVKDRWSNKILLHKGYIHQIGRSAGYVTKLGVINPHSMDALRHALHCLYFEYNKNKGGFK